MRQFFFISGERERCSGSSVPQPSRNTCSRLASTKRMPRCPFRCSTSRFIGLPMLQESGISDLTSARATILPGYVFVLPNHGHLFSAPMESRHVIVMLIPLAPSLCSSSSLAGTWPVTPRMAALYSLRLRLEGCSPCKDVMDLQNLHPHTVSP